MPVTHDVEQGSLAWIRLRTGLPTASSFDQILTPGGKPSASQDRYLKELLAEVLMGRAIQAPTIAILQRGHDLESTAVEYYEMQRDVETKKVGFVLDDSGRFGASPDREVGDDGMLEIKCPLPAAHIGYLLMEPASKDYWAQLQGQLLVTGRQWVDIVSYHPDMPMAVSPRVHRDEEYIALLSKELHKFCDRFDAAKKLLRDRGLMPEPAQPIVDAMEINMEDFLA